jgi:hypothetical protein
VNKHELLSQGSGECWPHTCLSCEVVLKKKGCVSLRLVDTVITFRSRTFSHLSRPHTKIVCEGRKLTVAAAKKRFSVCISASPGRPIERRREFFGSWHSTETRYSQYSGGWNSNVRGFSVVFQEDRQEGTHEGSFLRFLVHCNAAVDMFDYFQPTALAAVVVHGSDFRLTNKN